MPDSHGTKCIAHNIANNVKGIMLMLCVCCIAPTQSMVFWSNAWGDYVGYNNNYDSLPILPVNATKGWKELDVVKILDHKPQ
jgi:hypothetical protein